MRILFYFVILFFFNHCSFDNKSGIWKNENAISDQSKNKLSKFKTLYSSNDTFDKIVPLSEKYTFKIQSPINNLSWTDIYYDQTNNLENYRYNDANQRIFRSKKISRNKVSEFILFNNDYLIASDSKGNIITFSVKEKRRYDKFNFYKKRMKKIKKNLNIIIENNTIYVSDNVGYLYAYNFIEKKVLWAKNFKIPFRSNLKVVNEKLIAANQNNNLYFLDKNSGKILSIIPTEETVVKNQFINNVSNNDSDIFFLNTYGSLYSINKDNMNINWFLNLNQSIDLNPSNLFDGTEIINNKSYIIISTNNYTYVLDINTGVIINKINFSSLIKPIAINKYLFLITKNHLLIAWDLDKKKIIYSYDINQKIAEFLKTKKKLVDIKNMMIVNNKLFVFLKNSYVLKFSLSGNLEEVKKLSSKIKSNPIFIENFLMFLDKKNRLSILN